MSTHKPKAKPRGRNRDAFRATIEARLAAMGYPRSRYVWQDAPARLLMIIGDEMKPFAINAGRSAADVEFQMGRLATWAEVLRLQPREPREPRASAQLDLIDALGAAHAIA